MLLCKAYPAAPGLRTSERLLCMKAVGSDVRNSDRNTLTVLILSKTLSLGPRERTNHSFRMANTPVDIMHFLLHDECLANV